MSSIRSSVPPARVIVPTDAPVWPRRAFVLYWMTAARRARHNFALQRAVDWAVELGKPLLVVEVLRGGRPWDSRRRHEFVLQGMAANAATMAATAAEYRPLVEQSAGEADRTLARLAQSSCLVVTDDFPIPWIAPPLDAVELAGVCCERIDGNGLLPMRTAATAFPTAYAFRRYLQKVLPDHLLDQPAADPLNQVNLPPRADASALRAIEKALPRVPADDVKRHSLPIDHAVTAVAAKGGANVAAAVLERFLVDRLPRYCDERNEPDALVTSGLSPYLHFGHFSVHEVFQALAHRECWSPEKLGGAGGGKSRAGCKAGWWGMSPCAEAFLDELITWREVGFNFCCQRPDDFGRYDSLPPWALTTLDKHAGDARDHVYAPAEFEAAATHDELWNAAQRQLLREGLIHNYLRMLWGKKILQWSPSPREALETMIELNNKYAIDGCDPNSYSGIFWVLGRYDRPWGPERPVFGNVRYMTSENTARKVSVKQYLARYAA